MHSGLIHETYLMNLLGHAKLAREYNASAGEELVTAANLLGVGDANEHLRDELCRDFLKKGTMKDSWPREFANIREQLDQQYAPDSGKSAPSQTCVTPLQMIDFLAAEQLTTLSARLGVNVDDLFNRKWIDIYQRRWKIGPGASLLEVVCAVVSEAFKPERMGGDGYLEWFEEFLMSDQARSASSKILGTELIDYLREIIVAPRERERQVADAREIEHGFATLELPTTLGALDRLSYAALERRLIRLEKRVEQYGKELLGKCEAACPRLLDVVQLRMAASLELEGHVRAAVSTLVGERAAEEGEGEEPGGAIQEILQKVMAREEALALGNSPEAPEATPESVAAQETVAAWEKDQKVRLEWRADARHRTFVGPVRARRKSRPTGLARWKTLFGQQSGVPLGMEVIAGPDEQVVLSIYGLDARREELLEKHLPAAAEAAQGDTFEQRLASAVLGEDRAAPSPAEPLDAAPHFEVHGDLPARARHLLEQTLEVLNPSPLDYYGNVLMSLSPAGVKSRQLLETGDCLFECRKSLSEMIDELQAST